MKLTNNQLLWRKEINRIKDFIRRATKRGYTFDYEIPEMPDRVTQKKLEELRSETTPTKLYKRATYQAGDTVVSGYKGRELERKKSSKKAQKTKEKNRYYKEYYEKRAKEGELSGYELSIILDNLIDTLNTYAQQPEWLPPSRGRGGYADFVEAMNLKIRQSNVLLGMIDEQIEMRGRAEFTDYLKTRALEINDVLNDFQRASESSAVATCVATMMSIITGHSLSQEELKDIEDRYSDYTGEMVY